LNAQTAILWLTPFLVIIVAFGLFFAMRRPSAAAAERPLTKIEQDTLRDL
jgi:cytochrome c-type biogenesis protein CcmH/NrfF